MISILAGGGLAAAAVAGWTQIKNMFSYVSSFVMVTAELEAPLVRPMIQFLRYEDWQLVPGGKLIYRSDYFFFHREKKTRIVPFKVPPTKAIYRRGWRLLFVNLPPLQKGTITFVRGTVDLNALLKSALVRMEHEDSAIDPSSSNRYFAERVTGAEKGAWAAGAVRSNEGPSDARVGADGLSSSSPMPALYPALDKSFAYDASEWQIVEGADAFENLYFDPSVMRYIEQGKRWLAREAWHKEKCVPHRRGWLIYGEPGTGKTSLAKATAQSLRIPIYLFQLSTLSDQELIRKWADMYTPCVALFEDFDAVFHLRQNVTDNKSLTFDCILNVISGVLAREGVFLIVTTNHPEKIDPAMGATVEGSAGLSTRPGRLDTAIEVGFMNESNRARMAARILSDWPDGAAHLVKSHVAVTPAQFEEVCVQYAYARLAEEDAIVLAKGN